MPADEVLSRFTDLDYEPTDFEADDTPITNGKNLPFPAWHLESRCVGASEQTFFGARDTTERPAVSMSDIARAKAICAPCPVFRTCISTALGLVGENREEYGIWAGTSGRTRKRIWELVDEGAVTLTQVVDDICSGEGAKYERALALVPLRAIAMKELVA